MVKEIALTDTQTIKMNNNDIILAKFLGWFQEDGQPDTWYMKTDNAIVVVYSTYKDPFKRLPFSHDANYLIKVIEKIKTSIRRIEDTKKARQGEYFIDRFEIKLGSFWCTLYRWTKEGWVIDHVSCVIGENCIDWMDGLYKFLVKIVKIIAK